ncbi:MAG: PH domain-containing protein [Kurthia sp.]|nr:PH domain-containing protein [Candidatus Kurthia equi]
MNQQLFNDHITSFDSSLKFVENEINEISKQVSHSEDIIFATSGKMDGYYWLIACTKENLIMIKSDLLQKMKNYTIPYHSIVRVTKKSGVAFSKIEILTAATKRALFAFEFMTHKDVDTLRMIIKEHQNNQAILKMHDNTLPYPQKNEKTFHFHVVGVTGKNNVGDSIQTILQNSGKKYFRKHNLMKYDGLSVQEIKSFGDGVYEFSELYLDGSEILFIEDPNKKSDPYALLVYIKFSKQDSPIHIGSVPSSETKSVHKILTKSKHYAIEGHYVGGNTKMVDYSTDDSPSVVTVAPLDLGVEITLTYKK